MFDRCSSTVCCKEFENLQDSLARRVFRGLVILQDGGAAGQTMPDIVRRMATLELIASEEEWVKMTELRKQLAHEYPLFAEEQVKALNDAFAAIDPLLRTLQLVEGYVTQTSLLDRDGL